MAVYFNDQLFLSYSGVPSIIYQNIQEDAFLFYAQMKMMMSQWLLFRTTAFFRDHIIFYTTWGSTFNCGKTPSTTTWKSIHFPYSNNFFRRYASVDNYLFKDKYRSPGDNCLLCIERQVSGDKCRETSV